MAENEIIPLELSVFDLGHVEPRKIIRNSDYIQTLDESKIYLDYLNLAYWCTR